MKRFLGTLLFGMVLVSLPAAAQISGGNAVTVRSFVDATSNFALVDLNSPITGAGQITQWQVFAANTNQVELLIYHPSGGTFTLIGNSTAQTPVAGLNTFTLATPINVQTGDLPGLFFPGAGSVYLDRSGPPALNNLTGTVLFTATGAGIGAFTNSANATYSLAVSGTGLPGTPVPPSVMLMLVGLATVGFFAASGKFARA